VEECPPVDPKAILRRAKPLVVYDNTERPNSHRGPDSYNEMSQPRDRTSSIRHQSIYNRRLVARLDVLGRIPLPQRSDALEH
jgi:hypothetical protein